jgi:hypothetical protein
MLREDERSEAMDVSDMLVKAWAAVEKASLPELIQPVAFREAVRLLSGIQDQVQPSRANKPGGNGIPRGSAESSGDMGSSITEDQIFGRVAEHTSVDRDKLERIVHLDGDVVKVSIPGIKLGKNNAEKTRTVAQILTIVRGFGLDEAETSVDVVRAEVMRLKCYDSANFSSQLSKLSGFVITGSGANRRIRSRAPGITAFPGLVDTLLGAQ